MSAADPRAEHLAAALLYAGRCLPVFPLHAVRAGVCSCWRGRSCTDRGKHPRCQHGLRDASTDSDTIRQWWAQWPAANIGLRTGEPGGVDVLDVDPAHGGQETLDALTGAYGPLPPTWRVRTGSGGFHFYFQHWPGLGNSTSRIGRGLDVRASGGYVCAPPSLHASGQRYRWLAGARDVALAAWPRWLLELARQDDSAPASSVLSVVLPRGVVLPVPDGLRRWAEAGAGEGERNSQAFKLACALIRTCDATDETRALLDTFAASCTPPMDPREVERTWRSARERQSFSPSSRVRMRGGVSQYDTRREVDGHFETV